MRLLASALSVAVVAGCLAAAGPVSAADEPVALRVGGLIVAPAHTPPVYVTVKNLGQAPYRGTLAIKGPEGWAFKETQLEVSLGPGETKRMSFTVSRGTLGDANRHAIEVTATGSGSAVTRRQEIACCSAPFFKPAIDGDPSDWKDAIPVTFVTAGKKTIVSTFWNRRSMCVLVAVEEDQLVPLREDGPFDAVQLAIAPQESVTGRSPDGEATRYEFLVAAAGKGDEANLPGRCFLLARPGMKLAETQRDRPLAGMAMAEAAVSRKDGVTYYECAIPFKLLKEHIPPTEGREFCFSVLVHDPDGTGVRDWGQTAGLWPWERNRLAWSAWKGAKWGDNPPYDNKTPWGLCSSKF